MKKVLKAPAKVNLCLKVERSRKDGYHDLKMIMQAISLFDTIEIDILKENQKDLFSFLKSTKFNYKLGKQVNLIANYSYIPTDERNLVVKVANYFIDRYKITDRFYINLKKMIPTCGGLGGGSSDAASMIKFFNNYYKLKLQDSELIDIAETFGSDIPFFIKSKLSVCEKKGEVITVLKPYNNYFIVLATPNLKASTRDIFTKYDSFDVDEKRKKQEDIYFDNLLISLKNKNLRSMSEYLFNDLEIVTESMFSDITLFKKRMMELGALKSLMSGSGPSVFGIFNSFFKASNCKKRLKIEHPDAFVFIAKPI